ncbi:MAG: hypothetical protein JWP91_2273 [Fibrobacteres bacterium]|nr:hypothetical protein [Fibrobacterota bacterium]
MEREPGVYPAAGGAGEGSRRITSGKRSGSGSQTQGIGRSLARELPHPKMSGRP